MSIRAFKTEIKPTIIQLTKIHQTIGVCRYLYNLYIAVNKERYTNNLPFMSGNDFDKWVNNVHSHEEGFEWIKNVSSKARKKAIKNAEMAYKRFFNKISAFPRFKKKRNQNVNIYFIGGTVERHRIKVPIMGWVRLKEFGYIPNNVVIKSGTISYKAGRYYISVIAGIETPPVAASYAEGIGIDLGIKTFAITSNRVEFNNINKTNKVRKLEKRLKREQKKLSNKNYMRKQKGGEPATATLSSVNIDKQRLKVQKLYQYLNNIRTDYVNKVVNMLAITKPAFITVENLNVRGMMKNRHLAKAVAQQKFYEFITKLKSKARRYAIELRVVDRFYPSSKLCSDCGFIKKDLTLKDRIYKCDNCGLIEDRDINAAINLKNAKEYKVA